MHTLSLSISFASNQISVFFQLLSLFVPPPETMTTATSPILLKWDPKSLEIRTLTVERLLEPLVTQVGTRSFSRGFSSPG